MKIIGITGTLGAGKGTVVEYLVNKQGFKHFSVREYLIEEIKRRGLIVNRDSMTEVANELRAQHSPAYIIEQLYHIASKYSGNSIIESIRTPGEIDFLRQQGDFLLIAVDADPRIRYERIVKRGSETDNISYNTFVASEEREFNTDDPNKQNLSKCIQLADFVITNSGSIEDLFQQLEVDLDSIS